MTERAAEYVTAHVRLPRELYQMLKQRADKENTSMTGLIRESIVAFLTGQEEIRSELPSGWDRDSFFQIGSSPIKVDLSDGSVNHDRYLYDLELSSLQKA